MSDMWAYREQDWSTESLVGFSVQASDGGIGKIDEASNDVGASYIVVDTGPWIFGKKVLLPAGVIDRVDRAEETVYVSRSKSQIKDSPEFDADEYRDVGYRDRVGSYYEMQGPGAM
ncbi:PRC-barrel domain containing protein [Baekduia soli]|uniref:PRC-barrel domain containing protein n=1 Tax=Baekduia soli TaxID=496014 RepID=A0A5B8U8U3_9ACTN|nr:PRC-barrel domain containing protein [Baekduia soli]QEC49208.1 PRC-barrel domain containing protein [Baekduia soli]